MKKIMTIMIILVHTFSFAQTSGLDSLDINEFNYILNHTPMTFKIDSLTIHNHKFSGINLNTIGGLKITYRYQEYLNCNKTEIKWLAEKINLLATAFFEENNPILIRSSGGYSGCNEKRVLYKNINGKRVAILFFCNSCSGFTKYEDEFIKIFNDRTNKLIYN